MVGVGLRSTKGPGIGDWCGRVFDGLQLKFLDLTHVCDGKSNVQGNLVIMEAKGVKKSWLLLLAL